MSDIEFIKGLNFKAPNENAPDFVIASGSIKRQDLIDFLTAKGGDWINFQVKEAKSGKWYAAVDNWKPKEERHESRPAERSSGGAQGQDDLADIPFAPYGKRCHY